MTVERTGGTSAAARALSAAVELARTERPSIGLDQRILGALEERERLERTALARAALAPRPNRWRAALAIVASAGAAALFVVERPLSPPVTPELHGVAPPSAGLAPRRGTEHDPCLVRRAADGTAPAIDDFEDADDAILPHEGRSGFWRWVRETDAPGSAPAALPIPRPGGTAKNLLALRVKGGKLVDWGAALEFTFSPSCYDASRYLGIAFEARGPGRIYFSPRQSAVIPRAEGGTCDSDCHNPHVAKIELDRSWRTFEVRWSEVRQRGSAKPPLDATRLTSVAFLIRPEDTPYDVWIDNVRFIR